MYDSVGQTTPAFEVEYANVGAPTHDVHNAEGLIFFCRARESLSESFVIPAASQNPRHGDDIRVPVCPTCTRAPNSRPLSSV